jgi:hypothetical protein
MRVAPEVVAELTEQFAMAPAGPRAFLRIAPLPDERRFAFAFPQIVAVFRSD